MSPTPKVPAPPIPDEPAAVAAPEPPLAAQPVRRQPEAIEVIVAAFAGLGYALSARALLLLALVGGFILAMTGRSVMGLLVLIAYGLLAIIPLVILEVRKGR